MATYKLNSWIIVVLLAIIPEVVNAQTTVSGGIFTNTIWTKANSPYIVTDTVVVFPGYTLTIEPGVEVRFEDDMMLEIRQGKLLANGTSVDSITFTSNSPSPSPGKWGMVYIPQGGMLSEISYCNFHYANTGLNWNHIGANSMTHCLFSFNNSGCVLPYDATVESCDFINNAGTALAFASGTVTDCNISGNGTGVYFFGMNSHFLNCTFNNNYIGLYLSGSSPYYYTTKLDSCSISNNTIGVTALGNGAFKNLNIKNSLIDSNSKTGIFLFGYNDSITNCRITNNGVGLDDSLCYSYNRIKYNIIEGNGIGIKSRHTVTYACNTICNNVSYDIYRFSSEPYNASGNEWCTTDSSAIAARIYDAYDNLSLGIVTFLPFDTSQCSPSVASVSISGVILTETGAPVPGVTLMLSGDDFQVYTTDTTGRYGFLVAAGGTYTITPSKNNDVVANNGISTIDILLMQRHILNNALLNSPYKIIAAAECNADGNTQVSTLDLLFTRQLILSSANSYPTNRLWQFVTSDYVFPDNNHPFPFPTSRTYPNITTNQTNQNFIGIKLGDVNGSWDANVH